MIIQIIYNNIDKIRLPPNHFDDIIFTIEKFFKVSEKLMEMESENGGNLKFCYESMLNNKEIDPDELIISDHMIRLNFVPPNEKGHSIGILDMVDK